MQTIQEQMLPFGLAQKYASIKPNIGSVPFLGGDSCPHPPTSGQLWPNLAKLPIGVSPSRAPAKSGRSLCNSGPCWSNISDILRDIGRADADAAPLPHTTPKQARNLCCASPVGGGHAGVVLLASSTAPPKSHFAGDASALSISSDFPCEAGATPSQHFSSSAEGRPVPGQLWPELGRLCATLRRSRFTFGQHRLRIG